jgi:O-antigen biosynthesis protein
VNILFVTSAAPEKSPFFTNEKRPPLGLGFLIATARQKGHQVFFLDRYLRPTSFLADNFLQRQRIDMVGIQANTICFRDSLRLIADLDEQRRNGAWKGKIIVGGPHTAVAPETVPEAVDHMVIGEGETAFAEILDGHVRERIIRRERLNDLDALPFQPWDLFSRLPYDDACPWMEARPVFTLNTSRGCPFDCTFCSVDSVWGKRYTYWSAERIIAECEYLIRSHGARGIYFREDNFTLNAKRTEEFCRRIIAKNLRISWACETRVDTLDRDLVDLMAAAGCRAFYLGIESGSQRMLNALHKGISVEQIEYAVRWSQAAGIRVYCSLISGTPGERFGDFQKTRRLMRRLKPYSYGTNVFVGIPGSELYETIRRDHLYEFKDDIGLLYMPGFQVKCRYFYGLDSRELVDHEFSSKTAFDRKLELSLRFRRLKSFLRRGRTR